MTAFVYAGGREFWNKLYAEYVSRDLLWCDWEWMEVAR